MPLRIRRTEGSGSPSNLADGQLSAELFSTHARLWIGCRPEVSGDRRLLIADSSAYLPIRGGTLYDPSHPQVQVGPATTNPGTILGIRADTGYHSRIYFHSPAGDGNIGGTWSLGIGPGGQFALRDEDPFAVRINIDHTGLTRVMGPLQVEGVLVIPAPHNGINYRFSETYNAIGFGWVGARVHVYVDGYDQGAIVTQL